MDIQSIKEKLKKAWDLVLSPEEKIALKSAKTELEKIKLDEVKTKDGVITISYGEDAIVIGTLVFTINADGTQTPLADGTYDLQDGNTITVVAGAVTDIKPTVPQVSTPDSNLAPTAMEAQFATHKSDLMKSFEVELAKEKNKLQKEISELKKIQVITLSAIEKILNTPINILAEEEKPEPKRSFQLHTEANAKFKEKITPKEVQGN